MNYASYFSNGNEYELPPHLRKDEEAEEMTRLANLQQRAELRQTQNRNNLRSRVGLDVEDSYDEDKVAAQIQDLKTQAEQRRRDQDRQREERRQEREEKRRASQKSKGGGLLGGMLGGMTGGGA